MYTNETDHLPHETAIDYVLESLDENEVWTAEAHLRTCAQCQELLTQFQAVSDEVLFAIPPLKPPSRLRERLMKNSSAEGNTRMKPALPASAPVIVLYTLGLIVIILVMVNVLLVNQVRSLQTQQDILASSIKTGHGLEGLVGPLANPQVIPVTGSQTQGSLVVSGKGSVGILSLRNLPSIDPAHTFQAWFIQADGSAISADVFRANPGTSAVDLMLQSDRPLSSFAEIRVTVEPGGGSAAPASPALVTIKY